MHKTLGLHFAGLLLFLSILSCNSLSPYCDSHNGMWLAQEAKRNGKTIEIMKGAEFSFTDTSFYSNILKIDTPIQSRCLGDVVYVESEILKEINLFHVNDSSMDISFWFRDYEFELKLKRK